MSKTLLIEELAEKKNMSLKESGEIYDMFMEIVVTQLKKEGKFSLNKIGTFKLVYKKSRLGRNPLTGDKVEIPAKWVVKFKTSSFLKDKFN